MTEIKFTLKERMLTQVVDGECVLLDVAAGQYYGFNEVGTRIWQCLADGLDRGQIEAILAQEFEVTTDQAGEDLEAFVSELLASGLITATDRASV